MNAKFIAALLLLAIGTHASETSTIDQEVDTSVSGAAAGLTDQKHPSTENYGSAKPMMPAIDAALASLDVSRKQATQLMEDIAQLRIQLMHLPPQYAARHFKNLAQAEAFLKRNEDSKANGERITAPSRANPSLRDHVGGATYASSMRKMNEEARRAIAHVRSALERFNAREASVPKRR